MLLPHQQVPFALPSGKPQGAGGDTPQHIPPFSPHAPLKQEAKGMSPSHPVGVMTVSTAAR